LVFLLVFELYENKQSLFHAGFKALCERLRCQNALLGHFFSSKRAVFK